MKNSNELKTEISKTETRLNQLETQLESQTATFEVTQQGFIDGKADLDKLHTEQNKLTLLQQAVGSLKRTYKRLKAAFSEQSAAEARREKIKQMASAAKAVEPLLNEYLETRSEFNRIVGEYTEALINKAEAYQTKQIEYQAIMRELDPPLTDEEREEMKLDQKTRTMAAATYFNHPPVEYDQAIVVAQHLLGAKIDAADRAKRQAEYNKQRAERSGSSIQTR